MKLQKDTNHGRWYNDACGTAFALELIGERWSLLIVRELMFGGRRFSDLRAGLPGISAKVLTERLEGLDRAGVVQRRQLPPPAASQIYELTTWGYSADKTVMELGRWAACSPDHDPTLPLSAASLMMSFRTMFDPARANGLAVCGHFCIGQERFVVTVSDQSLRVERGERGHADFSILAPGAAVIAALVYGKVEPHDLAEARLAIAGDRSLLDRFVDLFHLPPKAF